MKHILSVTHVIFITVCNMPSSYSQSSLPQTTNLDLCLIALPCSSRFQTSRNFTGSPNFVRIRRSISYQLMSAGVWTSACHVFIELRRSCHINASETDGSSSSCACVRAIIPNYDKYFGIKWVSRGDNLRPARFFNSEHWSSAITSCLVGAASVCFWDQTYLGWYISPSRPLYRLWFFYLSRICAILRLFALNGAIFYFSDLIELVLLVVNRRLLVVNTVQLFEFYLR